MEKRAFDRFDVDIEIEFSCCNKVHSGTIINMSQNGMFIHTREMCLPFDSQLEILIPADGAVLRVPANLSRLEMSPDSSDGIGVKLNGPSEEYLRLIDGLRSSR